MVVGENRKNAFSFLPFNRQTLKRPNAAPSATKARAAAVNENKEVFKSLTGYTIQNKISKASTITKTKRSKL